MIASTLCFLVKNLIRIRHFEEIYNYDIKLENLIFPAVRVNN